MSSYLSAQRIQEFRRVGDISHLSLRQATASFREVPNDLDEGYVIDANFDGSDPLHVKFCIVWSTKRMSTTDIGDVIHSDCTYKCAWNGYPITMMGISDKNRKFHPVLLAVSNMKQKTSSPLFLMLGKK